MKLVEALQMVQQPAAEGAEPLRVLLACGFTPLHLQTYLGAYLRQRCPRHAVAVETGLFGDCIGSLERAAETSCAVVLEWSDLDPRLGVRQLGGWRPSDLPDILATVSAGAARFASAIEQAARRLPVAVCMPTVPLPPVDFVPGWRGGAFTHELHAVAAALAVRISRQPRVRLVNAERLDQCSPAADRRDVRMELASGFPYRPAHAAAVAEMLSLLLHPPQPRKGIITDLDNTLWAGVVGDAGVEKVSWDLDNHTHMHALYQQLLASLAEAGVLIAVASKNDPQIVEAALARPDLVLTRNCLFPLEVHWQAKSASVARILQTWNLGAESVVFVDDSPLELAEVQSAFPGMDCLLFPAGKDAEAYRLLQRLRDLFGKDALGAEDGLRRESLQNAQSFHALANRTDAADSLLQDLGAELTLCFDKAPFDSRAFELVNKTNQFNLNGRRCAEGAWQNRLDDPDTVVLIASYKDKFGPLGKIAVLSGRMLAGAFLIETWVMSCRAFARRIEHRCLEALFEHLGVAEIEFEYSATKRNRPMRDFLATLLGGPPVGGDRLTNENFRARCPALHHQVEVNDPCTTHAIG